MAPTHLSARPSFTVEIKRARRPTPESPGPTETSPNLTSLVDQVFGGPPKPLAGPPAPVTRPLPPASDQKAGTPAAETSSDLPTRRVLPDLRSAVAEPVSEPMREDTGKRAVAARRKRTERKPVPAASMDRSQDEVPDTIARAAPNAAAHTNSDRGQPEDATPSLKRAPGAKKNLRRLAMRAERAGEAMPRLPAGQRWKRRLPAACW
jgi:hypothetical protein